MTPSPPNPTLRGPRDPARAANPRPRPHTTFSVYALFTRDTPSKSIDDLCQGCGHDRPRRHPRRLRLCVRLFNVPGFDRGESTPSHCLTPRRDAVDLPPWGVDWGGGRLRCTIHGGAGRFRHQFPARYGERAALDGGLGSRGR